MRRISIAQDTVKILDIGSYISPTGKEVNVGQSLRCCLGTTEHYEPEKLLEIQQKILGREPQYESTNFEVKNETSLTGAQRISASQEFEKICVLNFASAKNPGGGFLKGAQAQEESLVRSSALYKSLLLCPEYYEFHRRNGSRLYSDRMIYSPDCPVFKTDDGTLLEEPYLVDFITSPAPNAGAILRNKPTDLDKIPEVFYGRATKLLSLAAQYNCDALILGAWGCGVFKNQSSLVARMFADLLLVNGLLWGRFKKVIFSVLDSSKNKGTFMEFNKCFAV
ncbi:MAG: TIGR02452 family protein [Mastigocoleus sp. MO_167.B18]|nr:TIGR02452 family protein [Mastigocoleus sp. MO_167.B18]